MRRGRGCDLCSIWLKGMRFSLKTSQSSSVACGVDVRGLGNTRCSRRRRPLGSREGRDAAGRAEIFVLVKDLEVEKDFGRVSSLSSRSERASTAEWTGFRVGWMDDCTRKLKLN
jgi:hypothetical protein